MHGPMTINASVWSERVQSILDDTGVPGSVISVRVDGEEVQTHGFGLADGEHQTPMAGDERFYVYSVTKSLLAVVVLHLADRGSLTLEDSIQAHLPELHSCLTDERITIRRLLNHSSGLPDYGPMSEYAVAVRNSPAEPWSPEEFLSRTLASGLAYEPGHGWGYSNIGYLILKLLVERVNAASLQDVFHAEIFAPLGLRHSLVASSMHDTVHLSPGFSHFFTQDERLEDISRIYHPGWVSHGVVISTASEIALLVEAIMADDSALLMRELRQEMLDPIILPFEHPPFGQPAYGLGVMIDAASPYSVVAGHGGGGPGYSIAAFHFSDVHGRAVTLSAIANSDRSDIGMRLLFDALDLVRSHL